MSNRKYDPNVKYGWDENTKFELAGNEFGLILNTFRSILASPESQKVLIMNNASNVMEEILKRNVESGNVEPAPIASPPKPPMTELDHQMAVVKDDN